MTMKLTITNEDPGRTAEVEIQEANFSSLAAPISTRETIPPRESRSFWIHAAKRLLVTENPNASIPPRRGGEAGSENA